MASDPSPPANKSSDAVATHKAPLAYPPCIHAAKELDPIAISQMKIETHHRGERVIVRVLIPPIRDVALITLVEDEEGTSTRLYLLFQPSETVVPAERTLRLGGCYLIKEPFFTADSDGSGSLRVDHPSDIILLPFDHELIPTEWKKGEISVGKSREMRIEGNNAVGKKKWAEAEDLYTLAIRMAETEEELHLACLNRALANIRLGRPATALADAIKSSGTDGSARTDKGIFREASALYDLGKYGQCLDRLQALRAAYPNNTSALKMIEQVRARIQEQQKGQYDFRHMYKQAEATPPLVDCATYTMPVEIRDSPGKGRGVFTKKNVRAGEMLICEKAFGYVYGGKDHPDSRNKTDLDVQLDLRAQIVQRLAHNIEDAQAFAGLYHGDYDAVSVDEVDGKIVVDSFLVGKTIALTSFRCDRTSLSLFNDIVSGDLASTKLVASTAGVWSFISHINHSCISNISRSFIGDMLMIRAARDLEAGAELLISYDSPLPLESYDEAQKRVRHWGFTCGCALCLDRKATHKTVLLKRKALSRELDQFKRRIPKIDIPKAQRMLDQLNETYSAVTKEPGAVRLEICGHYHSLAAILAGMRRLPEAIEMTLKGLEAQGFVISVKPPGDSGKSSKPELRIIQWGLPDDAAVLAFWTLHLAYKRIAPENSKAARDYLDLAYAMSMGEKETILDTFPGLG